MMFSGIPLTFTARTGARGGHTVRIYMFHLTRSYVYFHVRCLFMWQRACIQFSGKFLFWVVSF